MTEIKSLLRRLPAWLPSYICLGLILYLTLARQPLGDNDVKLFPNADKVVHAIMFGALLGVLCIDKWRKDLFRLPSISFVVWSGSGVIFLGGLIEILQMTMNNGRSADILDFVSDSIGVILVELIYLSNRCYGR